MHCAAVYMQLFEQLANSRDKLNGVGFHVDMWLNLEAFEYEPDSRCSGHGDDDTAAAAAGMPAMTSRTNKTRSVHSMSVSQVSDLVHLLW